MQSDGDLRPVPSVQDVFGGEAYRQQVVSTSLQPEEYAVKRALQESAAHAAKILLETTRASGHDDAATATDQPNEHDHDSLWAYTQTALLYIVYIAVLLVLYRMLAVRVRSCLKRLFARKPTTHYPHAKRY